VDLLEIEQVTVKVPPLVHVAAEDVMGQVVEIIETHTFGTRVALAKPIELGVVGRSLCTIGFDKIEQ
jgi:hypothetical protein